MLTKASAVYLAVGLSLGYVAAGRPASAGVTQTEPAFFDRGDELVLTFVRDAHNEHGVSIPCAVADVQGRWVRCAPADRRADPERRHWYNLDYAVQVQVTRGAR